MSKLLRLKRAELAGVLAGGAKPPPLAALLFRWALGLRAVSCVHLAATSRS